MNRATYVDVSQHQGTINAAPIKAAGFSAMVARCTIGINADTRYSQNRDQAEANDLIFGAYHVLWPRNRNPLREAENFLTRLENPIPPWLVLDVEVHSEQDVWGQMKTWLDAVEAETGIRAWVYSGSWFMNRLPVAPVWTVDYHYWEAEYLKVPPGQDLWLPNQAPQEPRIPFTLAQGWKIWKGWQWTSSGKPVGVGSASLDYNVFDGTEAELRELLNLEGPDPTLEDRFDALEGWAKDQGYVPPF